jgi:hypothetical protein
VDKGSDTTLQAVAREKETFHQRSDEELRSLSQRLLFETETDESGNFIIELGEKQKYKGGAFEIDFECGTVPIKLSLPKPPKPKGPFQFHVTTLQPTWSDTRSKDQTRVFPWEYSISSSFWCRILKAFGMYVVCGEVSDCDTKAGLYGVRVKAFDVDLIQDDPLGEAFTDSSGHFKIYYTEADFSKTIFSWLNVEWPAGPDIYFSVESSSGTVLLQEDRQTGHRSDRQNVPNCFCVKLCIPKGVIPETPWFTHVGNFNITGDLNASGKTILARGSAGGADYGFFGSVKLKGYATKRVPTAFSSPLFYRFLYSLDSGASYNPVTDAQLESTELLVGTRNIPWGSVNMFQDVVIDKNFPASAPDSIPLYDGSPNPPRHIIRLDANGWVRVDQVCLDNGFLGPLLYLNTNALVPGGVQPNPGGAPGLPATSPKNGQRVSLKFQITDDPTNLASPHFHEQLITAQIYVNNWQELSLLTIEELFAGGATGCNPVATNAHVKYTVDHELIGSWSLTASSSAIPGGITGLPSGSVPRGVSNTIDLATPGTVVPAFPAGWPSCAYSMVLTTVRKLTNGESNDLGKTNQIIFCR